MLRIQIALRVVDLFFHMSDGFVTGFAALAVMAVRWRGWFSNQLLEHNSQEWAYNER